MDKTGTRGSIRSLPSVHTHLGQTSLCVLAWVITLLVSSLPTIISQEFHIFSSFPILWAQIILLGVFITLSFVWKFTQPLRPYFAVFLALYVANALFTWIGNTSVWQNWFGGASLSFSHEMLGNQLLRLGVAMLLIVGLWLLKRPRSEFFLAKGELNAVAEPVHWLGMGKPTGWIRFGIILAVCITLGTLAFLVISARPSPNTLVQVLPLLPMICLLAALNAFSEETAYRAVLLAPLYSVVGKPQALLLTAVLFGLWHYYGVPYGIVGVIMAGGLGWLLAKSMVETKGLLWAWFIHFWQDVAVFTFLAMGSISPGG